MYYWLVFELQGYLRLVKILVKIYSWEFQQMLDFMKNVVIIIGVYEVMYVVFQVLVNLGDEVGNE